MLALGVFSGFARVFLLPADLLPYLLAARGIDRAGPGGSALAYEASIRARLHGWLVPLVQQGLVCPLPSSTVRRPHVAWLPFVDNLPAAARRLWNCFASEVDDLSALALRLGVRRNELLAHLNGARLDIVDALHKLVPYHQGHGSYIT